MIATEVTQIATRSRKEAMDWSLVLISQGIESEIFHEEEDSKWSLLVSSQDHQRAISSIRQYIRENKGYPWRKEVFRPGLLFDWASLAWICLVILFFVLDRNGSLTNVGIMKSSAISAGEWWRLFTAVWIHNDMAHLAANAVFGFVLLGLAMGQMGTGTGVLAAYLAGAGGNLIAPLFSPKNISSLGASGMVMGCLGLIAAYSLPHRGGFRFAAKRYLLSGVAAGFLLFILLGLNPGSYVQAHVGGFICGLLIGGLFQICGSRLQSPRANAVCALIFTTLVIVPWWLAFHK